MCFPTKLRKYVSTHSRPKAAGFGGLGGYRIDIVSTHSRPKAAGICFTLCRAGCGLFQLTAARRRLGNEQQQYIVDRMFQLTAARRRLGLMPPPLQSGGRFNSQPPEGGWVSRASRICRHTGFNSQPPEGGWSAFAKHRQ